MRVRDLDKTIEGKRIRVTVVARSPDTDAMIRAQGVPDDIERLTGQEGTAEHFNEGAGFSQLRVHWDDKTIGLHLAAEDEIEEVV